MDAADYSFAHSINVFASTSKTGEVLEARDYVLANTKAPIAEFNQAFLKTPEHKLSRTLDRALAFYRRANVPFRIQVASEHAAIGPEMLARGFTQMPSIPCMVLHGAPNAEAIRPRADASDLTVRQVDDALMLSLFQRIAFESFGYPLELAPLALTDELMALPHVALFIGYVGTEPACCSALLITGDTAGIYWVGTLEMHRKSGLGAAITAHAVLEGYKRGCSSACLQASPMGQPVYTRLGFVEKRQYLRFDHLAVADLPSQT